MHFKSTLCLLHSLLMVPHLEPLPFWLFLQVHSLHPILPPVILLSSYAGTVLFFQRCWRILLGRFGFFCGGLFWVVFFFFGREKNKEGRLGVFTYCILVLCNSYPKYSFFVFFFHQSCQSSLWWTALITNVSFFWLSLINCVCFSQP